MITYFVPSVLRGGPGRENQTSLGNASPGSCENAGPCTVGLEWNLKLSISKNVSVAGPWTREGQRQQSHPRVQKSPCPHGSTHLLSSPLGLRWDGVVTGERQRFRCKSASHSRATKKNGLWICCPEYLIPCYFWFLRKLLKVMETIK